MDWLLKHPILIIVIVMVVSSLFKRLTSAGEAPSSSPGRQPLDSSDDSERTRRLQEEIRRKIAERRGQPMPPPVPVPETPAWSEPEEPWAYERKEPPQPPPLAEAPAVPAVDPILERQRALAEQLAMLQQRHSTVSKASQEAWSPLAGAKAPAASASLQEVNWLRELRNARSLRKAIVLREVIGPPVALR